MYASKLAKGNWQQINFELNYTFHHFLLNFATSDFAKKNIYIFMKITPLGIDCCCSVMISINANRFRGGFLSFVHSFWLFQSFSNQTGHGSRMVFTVEIQISTEQSSLHQLQISIHQKKIKI